MSWTILVIDDDEKLNRLLKRFLKDYGFEVYSAVDADEGLKKCRTVLPDLIILDVMLPGMTGFDVCKRIRESSTVPIIMLTARGDVMDKVVGLELGADDYLPKPFEPRELVARIQNIFRRGRTLTQTSAVIQLGDMVLDLEQKRLTRNGDEIAITATEYELLRLLLQNREKVLSRDEIMRALRGIDADIYSRAIDVLVSRLRQKLLRPELIRTVRGQGYQLVNR